MSPSPQPGLCAVIEVLLDPSAHPLAACVPLFLWTCVAVLQLLWHQIKQDATLGHRIMGMSLWSELANKHPTGNRSFAC